MIFKVEIDSMSDTRAFSNEQGEPQDQSHTIIDDQAGRGGAFFETLEDQITHRAHEISLRRGNHHEQSLASWLEAAREILSEDSESSH